MNYTSVLFTEYTWPNVDTTNEIISFTRSVPMTYKVLSKKSFRILISIFI